jgi:hypothetical protein
MVLVGRPHHPHHVLIIGHVTPNKATAVSYEGKSKIIRTFVFPMYLQKSRG